MTAAWLLFSLLAALGFYLACTHQQLWPKARAHHRLLRVLACVCAALATAAAVLALGIWAGTFAAFTALMLALVALPYLDAGWRGRRGDVG